MKFTAVFILILSTAFSMVPVSAENFSGRLFTTEAERRDLNALRLSPPKLEPNTSVSTAKPMPKKTFQLTVHGIVYRKDGNHQLWVDDPALLSNEMRLDHITPDTAYFKSADQTIILPAGKTYLSEQNQAIDLWAEGGTLTISPP